MEPLRKTILKDKSDKMNQEQNAYKMFKSNNAETSIAMMFEKKFRYQNIGQNVWKLQPPKTLFNEYYQFDELQKLKQILNNIKSKLNDYSIEEWSAHTRKKDPAGEIPWRLKNETQAEFVTVAWCKFFECLHRYPLVKGPKLNTLHLCEAPGAFIAALNHYLYSSYDDEQVHWKWLSTTMNPYYEENPLSKMIIDDRFMLYTLDHWLFHDDFTGNIIDPINIEDMKQQCTSRLEGGVQLITADGSIDCVEVPDCQEEYVATLHFAELVTALSILAVGGNFVVKMFTLFEAASVSKMYLLNCVFEEVHVFKPATSKRGNSEVYVICLGYKKHTQYLGETLALMKQEVTKGKASVLPLFAKSQIPREFLLQHEICVRLFMNFQKQAIESNIYTFELDTRHNKKQTHLLRTQIYSEFYKRYRVQPIPEELKILYRQKDKIKISYKQTTYKGSYTERKMQQNTTREEQIFMLHTQLNELEKSLCGRYGLIYDEDVADGELNVELHLYNGKPIDKVQSSLFVAMHVLLLRTKLQNIFTVDPIWSDAAMCKINEDCTITFGLTAAAAAENYALAQQKFFVRILDAIIEQRPQQVMFINFPFLTHYAVSMLHYLTLMVFNHISIAAETNFTITLCTDSGRYCAHVLDALTKLHNLLKMNMDILCIVDIIKLHRNEFSKALIEYNSFLLLKNFKLMLNN